MDNNLTVKNSSNIGSIRPEKNYQLPGIVDSSYINHWKPEGYSNIDHHSCKESISSSSLKLLTVSPYTYLAELKKKQNGIVTLPTKSMKFGTIVHMMLLEPLEFKKRFVIAPKFDMRTKIGKEGKQLFDLECPEDAVVMNAEEYDDFMGVIEAILNHGEARNIFVEGVTERSGFYRDPITGILCRIRPDFISTSDNLNMFIDLKTAKDSSYRGFQSQVWSLRYDLQLAMYREGIKEITGNYPQISAWVVVENKYPYEVAIYPFDQKDLETSTLWYRHCLDKLAYSMKTNNFHQRQITNENMVLPHYATMTEIPQLGE